MATSIVLTETITTRALSDNMLRATEYLMASIDNALDSRDEMMVSTAKIMIVLFILLASTTLLLMPVDVVVMGRLGRYVCVVVPKVKRSDL